MDVNKTQNIQSINKNKYENMDPSCLFTTEQAGGVMVWGMFWASFKCHSRPEHCFWPCPSLYGHHVPILWWLLPAG